MRPHRLAVFAVPTLALALVAASPPPSAAAPQPSPAPPAPAAPPPDTGFVEAIDVRVVNVEVVVTDRRGGLVRGLGPGDFELLIDGEPVPIDYFTEVIAGTAVQATAPPGAAAVEALPALRQGAAAGRSFLVFIDESFAVAAARDQVLARLERDLEQLAPADRMAVVAYDGRGLDLLAPWSGDRAVLAAALERARRRPAGGLEVLAARRSIRREEVIVATGLADRLGGAGPVLNPAVFRSERWLQLASRVEGAVAATGAAMRGVPLPEGRKVLLLLSGGWPFAPDDDLLHRGITQIEGESLHLPRGGVLYRAVTDAANLLGYTIYPVDVAGTDPLSNNIDIERASPGLAVVSSAWEHETHDALHFLAEETGGRPLLNSARLEALPRVARDTDSYYWLGFTPQWRADDRRHRVEVRLAPRGLVARFRTGFIDQSDLTRTARHTESVLLFGGTGRSDLPVAAGRRLQVLLGRPERSGFSTMRVPLTIVLPAEALGLIPIEGGYRALARLSFAALDRWGGRSDLPQVPLTLTLPEPPRPGSFVRHQMDVELRRTEQRLVVAVHDGLSGAMLFAELDVAP